MTEDFLSPSSCSTLKTAQEFSVPVFLLFTLTFFFLQILCSVLGWGPEKQSQRWILSRDTSVRWSAAIGKSEEANE